MLEQYPNELKYVVKHFPLSSHKLATEAAMAVLAAGNQGKFWEFHSRLLESYNQLSQQKILEIAGNLGLNLEKFNQDRVSPVLHRIIQEDIANGEKVGVRGTPTVFLNGKRVRNPGDLPQLIQGELNNKGKP